MLSQHTIGPIEALGTKWYIELFAVDTTKITPTETALTEEMRRFESMYSRFNDDSQIGQLNRGTTIDSPSTELKELLKVASTAFEQTAGVFNIGIGDYLEKSGYDQKYSFTLADTLPSLPLVNIAKALLEAEILRLPSGVKIDFGGFGKGFLIDKLASLLKEKFAQEFFLINGGGDIYASSDHGKPILIALQHPTKQTEICGELLLLNQGFAASSPHVRAWIDQHSQPHNHLIGTGTKQAVFVTAESATMADIWATSLAINPSLQKPTDVSIYNFQ